jgi:hypothetical protein
MQPTKSVHRSIATLKLPRRVGALIPYAQNMVTAMTGNPSFPSPVPPLTVVTGAINALQAAEAAALSRLKGAVTARNDRKAALITLLQQLRGYIQTTADANPENSANIIESAGIPVKKLAMHKQRVFAATPGVVPGTVKLVTPSAGPRSSYDWSYSADGGKTWVEVPSTVQAKTIVTGLSTGAAVQFRYRAVTKKGQGDWSQPVSLTVK